MNNANKLKQAAEDIKDVLRKHDITGAVVLHGPPNEVGGTGFGEFLIHITSSYSCAYMYEDNSVRFYSKRKDYNSREEQEEKLRVTANMVRILTDGCAVNFLNLEQLGKVIDKSVNATHIKMNKNE